MTTTSIGLQDLRKRIGEKAKADPHHRFWGMHAHVWKEDVLREAYRLAKKNNGAPGVDGVTFKQIEAAGVEGFIETLSAELREQRYQPHRCREVRIPKEGGKTRGLQIPTVRDRVVQGAVRLITEPIFEADFQQGSYGYRPGRTAHQALERVKQGLGWRLRQVINLDLQAYFDTVRHDLLLSKLAKRIRDKELLHLCKLMLKSGGKRGLPQGSVIGPLWANVFLNDIDKMLEQAQRATRRGPYENVRYVRYADDLVVLVDTRPQNRHWVRAVEQRLRQELEALDLTINEEKSGIIDFESGEPFDFLGYTFRWVPQRKDPTKKMVLARPQKKKRTRFLRTLNDALRRSLHIPIKRVVQEIVNPRVRGWVNYFRWGNASQDLSFVSWQVDMKIRRFATRQRPKNKPKKGGRRWTTWSTEQIYTDWGLFSDYRVAWCRDASD